MSLDTAASNDKNKEKPPQVGFSNLELKQIRKKQIKAWRQKTRKDVFIKLSDRKK